jgi:hypothetical protein
VLARLEESHRQYPDEGAKLAEHVEKVFIGLAGSSTPYCSARTHTGTVARRLGLPPLPARTHALARAPAPSARCAARRQRDLTLGSVPVRHGVRPRPGGRNLHRKVAVSTRSGRRDRP